MQRVARCNLMTVQSEGVQGFEGWTVHDLRVAARAAATAADLDKIK
jgi:hypothetical protein